ncbi:hypothetical protein [Pleionea sp. CnH1-48]|uniref:hypothetical protein n=1 Tax=Pleionea sp. CnH1-48 TaxID=2954494 RepID=UPI002098097C|nr:hypothetical protein [Pleionea sp. CnH1-48]MCO7224748.1 hypothetical protein [Pleionea sp. CnH1-48]
MIDKKLKLKVGSAIRGNLDLAGMSLILKKYEQSGGSQSDAIDTLESMRVGLEEEYEDKLLEMLDVASGFCNSKFKVW